MDLGQQYGAVAAVLCLLGGALWWLRRRGAACVGIARRGARRMESLERLSLGPQHSLHLVRIGRTLAVVSCSPGGCSLLQAGVEDADGGGRP